MSRLEKLLHDRWMRWNADLFWLQRMSRKASVSLRGEMDRVLHRVEIAEEDWRGYGQKQ